MVGTVSADREINVAASKAWELYGSLQPTKIGEEQLKNVVDRVEVVEGDGGVGTILHLVFLPELGIPGLSSYKEKFTKVDDEKRVKEVEVVEGGYLEMGFTFYRIRLEIIEKSEDSCITRATIEYDLKEEAAANASMVNIQLQIMLMEAAANYLTSNTTTTKN